jgi:glycerophosphoryl diester phosphodiesterase
MSHPYFDLPKPIVVGHRGASGELPENTLPAFERALSDGAAILETDVHLTRDGEVVLCHDPQLDRTTDGTGAVEHHTLAELRDLDAGYHFSRDAGASFPERGKGIRIPTLNEAFEAFPGIRFNVEVKRNSAALIEATVAIVAETGREAITLLAAEADDTMSALRAHLAATGVRPAMGAAVGDVVGFVRAAVEGGTPPPEPMALQVPPSFAGAPLVTPEFLEFAHRHDVQVHVWTINEEDEMRRLLDLGVDAVMSDFPGLLRKVVDERGLRS